jgi:hypothetical protein
VNAVRDEFEKGGLVADIFAKGKDVEIFEDAAKKADKAIQGISGSYEEYLGHVTRYNEQAEVEEMHITAVTESRWELNEALREAGESGNVQRQLLIGLGSTLPFVGDAFVKVADSVDEYKESQERLAEAAEVSDRAMLAAARRQTEIQARNRALAKTEYETAQAQLKSLQITSPEVNRILEEQASAQETFLETRKKKQEEYNEEYARLQAEENTAGMELLTIKHNDELAEIDRRYLEESARRKQAIGEALLDLNTQIEAEKLLREGLGLEEAAQISEFHRQRAEIIGGLYDIDFEKRYADAAAETLRTFAISNEEIETITNATFDEVLQALQRLDDEGWNALSTRQREWISDTAIANAEFVADNGGTVAEVIGALSLIPEAWGEDVSSIIEQGGGITQILASIKELGTDTKATVGLEVDFADPMTRLMMGLNSPTTTLQLALESLQKYAKKTAIALTIGLTEGSAESIQSVVDNLIALPEITEVAAVETEASAMIIIETFNAVEDGVTGPNGSMTKMVDGVKKIFLRLSAASGFVSQFKESILDVFEQMGEEIKGAMGGVSYILFEAFGKGGFNDKGILGDMVRYGYDMMVKLEGGIVKGLLLVKNAVAAVNAELDNIEWDSGFIVGNSIVTQDQSVVGGGGGGGSNVFGEGAISLSFPNVTDADEIREALTDFLNDSTSRGRAFSTIGA